MTTPATDWSAQPERGSRLWLRVMLVIVRTLGGAAGRAVLLPITAWFLATSPAQRASSRTYLGRVLGRPAGTLDVARHFHAFARSILDRALMLMNRVPPEALTVKGTEHVIRALAPGRGCLLLGAHLGGLEALGLVARLAPVRVRPMMFRRNAGPLTALMERLDPGLRTDVIELGNPHAMLDAHEAVQQGEIICLLADRAPAAGEGRWVQAPFLGRPAPFPAGPFALAHALGVPVLLFHAVRTGRQRWLVRFEPLAERITLRRGPGRDADLAHWVRAYAAALERNCRSHPYQWFNFHPFWGKEPAQPASPARRVVAGLMACAALPAPARAQAPLDLSALMARLAAVPERRAAFREEKRLAALAEPVLSRGQLIYRRPSRLEKLTTWPEPESLVIDGDRVVLTLGNEPPRSIPVAADPGLRAIVDAFRATLAGDLATLSRSFAVRGAGTAAAWQLDLTPSDPAVGRVLRSVRLTGGGADLREVLVIQANGDEQRLAVDPLG